MATATLSPPEEIEVEITAKEPKVKVVKVKGKKAKKAEKARLRRAAEQVQFKTKKAARKSWKAFRSGLSWMKRQMIRLYSWAKRNAKRAWMRSLQVTSKARARVATAARSSASWLRSASIGAWAFTAPARTWIATPFRMAFGTSAGLASLLLFGGKLILLVAIPWLIYLLYSGKLVMDKRDRKRKARKVRKAVIVEEATVGVATEENHRRLNQAQMNVIGDRIQELMQRTDAASEKNDKNMFSDLSGRLFLAEQRLLGRTDTVSALAKAHRHEAEGVHDSPEAAAEVFTWTAVKRGMTAEQQQIQKLIDDNAGDPVTV